MRRIIAWRDGKQFSARSGKAGAAGLHFEVGTFGLWAQGINQSEAIQGFRRLRRSSVGFGWSWTICGPFFDLRVPTEKDYIECNPVNAGIVNHAVNYT